MSRGRRAAFWLLLTAGLALFVGWIFFVPYRPGVLYRAIPNYATVVSTHVEPAARWDELSRNPLMGALFPSDGGGASIAVRLAKDPKARRWMEWIAPREVVAAYLPSRVFGEGPAWVFASWLGGRSQVLRWLYGVLPHTGAVAHPLPAGGRYWTFASGDYTAGRVVSFAFLEGMVVGAVADSPRPLLALVETFEGRFPSVARRNVNAQNDMGCREVAATDFGWLRLPDQPGLPAEAWYSFAGVDNGQLKGTLCVDQALVAPAALKQQLDLRWLENVVGDAPLAFLAAEPLAVSSLLGAMTQPVWTGVFADTVLEQGIGSVALTVLGDDWHGRYMNIKVPTMLLCVRVKDPIAALEKVKKSLDRLNAQYQWGLIPREVSVAGDPVFAIEATAGDRSDQVSLNERMAYTVVDEWLLVASNLEQLTRLVARHREDARREAGTPTRWMAALEGDAPAAVLWLDLARSGTGLRALLKIYSLKLLVTEGQHSQPLRQRLNLLAAWTTALEPMKECRLALEGDDTTTQLQFVLGPTP